MHSFLQAKLQIQFFEFSAAKSAIYIDNLQMLINDVKVEGYFVLFRTNANIN